MSESLLIIIVSFFITVATTVIASVVNRRATFSKANADSSDAAESLSESAKNIIQTYEASVVKPLRDRIDELRQQVSVIEEDRFQERLMAQREMKELRTKVGDLDRQVVFLIGELRRADSALELLGSLTRETFPKEVDRAIRIRRGQE